LTYLQILPYLEGAAYIAIVIAVLGVPQLLSSYFDIRERRRTREEERRTQEEERRTREDERRADELRRSERQSERQLEAERIRRQERADSERQRMDERTEAERQRMAERADAERRHQETLTALMGIIATRTNGGRGAGESQDGTMQEILRRLAAIEAALGLQPDSADGASDESDESNPQ
jgi:hypothetical protein